MATPWSERDRDEAYREECERLAEEWRSREDVKPDEHFEEDEDAC